MARASLETADGLLRDGMAKEDEFEGSAFCLRRFRQFHTEEEGDSPAFRVSSTFHLGSV